MSARFRIAVAGGKGGVGKSTVTLNLGLAPWTSQTQRHDVFPRVTRERSIWEDGIERLASIPLDPALARVNGVPFAFTELAEGLERQLA